jgi:hypothetical protein
MVDMGDDGELADIGEGRRAHGREIAPVLRSGKDRAAL